MTYNKADASRRSAWTKADIRAARKIALAPLLIARGLTLQPLPDQNYRLSDYDDLLVKKGYWRWPSKGIEGNAIDYFVLVEGKSFRQAMDILSAAL